jgi:hypothetical protein
MMKKHFQYLGYIIRHKYFVFVACLELKVPLWQAVVHDYSKLSKSEWFAYTNFFYGEQNTENKKAFFDAWKIHCLSNPHHWQYWLKNAGQPEQIPDHFVREMVADWKGAGLAKKEPNLIGWYEANKIKIKLHLESRKRVEELIYGNK